MRAGKIPANPPDQETGVTPWQPAAAGALLLFLVVLAYLPAARAGFVWDDDHYVTENPDLQTLTGLRRIWLEPESSPQYYPLVFSSFWVEYHLWGLRPEGYHGVNILLHGLNAVLFWRVLSRLKVPGAWFAGALFALHPVHVESVAWVTERKNVLSGLFNFSAALAYWRFASPESEPALARKHRAWYGATLVLFVGALLSKTVTASLPAALGLMAWWKRGKITWKDGLALLPMGILGMVFALNTLWLERHHVGAEGQEWSLSWAQRVIIAGRALWFYAGKLVWPVDLTFIYPRWEIDSGLWWLFAYPLAVTGILGVLWLALAPLGRGALTACLFFAGTLLPALGFFDVFPMRYSFVADHFQYLASVGLISLAAATSVRGWQKLGLALQPLKYVAGCAVLLLLGILTWAQSSIYHDEQTLWEDTLARNPGCWLAHNNLGKECYQHGLFKQAEQHFSAALAGVPASWTRTRAQAYSNLGVMREAQGKLAEASADYERAIGLDPDNVSFRLNLGSAFARQGKTAEAQDVYTEVLRQHPAVPLAHYSLGILLAEQGNWSVAADCFHRAIDIQPAAQFRYRLAIALRMQGEAREAILQFQEAKRDPEWPAAAISTASYLAAHSDAKVRDSTLAVQLASEACQATDYQEPTYLDTLGVALAEAGRFEDALTMARRALTLASEARLPNLEKRLRERLLRYKNHQTSSGEGINP